MAKYDANNQLCPPFNFEVVSVHGTKAPLVIFADDHSLTEQLEVRNEERLEWRDRARAQGMVRS